MRDIVAGSLALLAILLLVAVCADRGIPAALESLAFAIHQACAWISHRSMRALLGTADKMRARRTLIEVENRKRRAQVEI